MRILFVTYDLPYPLDQGGKVRAYNLIKNLSRQHQITLFSFFRHLNQKQDIEKVKPFCQKILLFKRMKVFSPFHLFFSLVPVLPFPIALYWSPKLKKVLQDEIESGSYDIVHFESFYTSLYLNRRWKVPQVLGTENIEWRVYRKYAEEQKLPLLKYLMVLESWRIKQFEKQSWKKADVCLTVSQENRQEIIKVTHKKVEVIDNGVDLDFFKYHQVVNRKQKTILFVGNFSYIQNRDAVLFLVKEIFPLIKNKIEGVKLLIVGKNPSEEIRSFAGVDIEMKDNVQDIREVYSRADVLLAPIRAGSGTKFKILEAMASGLPVVTTSIGIEGIRSENERDVIVSDDPEEIACRTAELLKDKNKRESLGKAARELVEKNYSWLRITEKLEKVYQELVYG